MFRISFSGVTCALWFVLFSFVGRFLYPFGDEPDFTVRAFDLINGDHSLFSPYRWLDGLLESLNYSSSCMVVASPFSLWANIDPISCSETLSQMVARFFIAMTISSPLILAICLIPKRVKNAGGGIFNHDGQRGEALGLTLLIPGVTYSMGLMAEEQLVVALSLLLIMFDRRWIATLILLAAILALDFGNGIVVVSLAAALSFYRYVAKFFSIRLVAMVGIAQALLALTAGIAFIDFLSNIWFLTDKATAIYAAVGASDLIEKYPIYLRPIITFMTGVFMTPSFVKIVPAFLLLGAMLIIAARRLVKIVPACENGSGKVNGVYLGEISRARVVDAVAVIATVLSFIFLLPTYSNAKYYFFAIPFLIHAFLLVMPRRRILLFLISSQIVVFLGLTLYRL